MKDRNEKREETLKHLVTTVANEANIKEKEVIEREIDTISKMKNQEAIDYILITLNRFYEQKILTEEQIFSNAKDILSLSTQQYKKIDDLLNRLFWIKSRNFDHQNTSLRENHELVMETFDKLNDLIENLNERDKKVVLLRFFKEKTQKQVANVLGITQVQVSRIERRILGSMKLKLSS